MAEYIDKHEAYLLLKDLEVAYIYPPVKEAYATAARRVDKIKAADVQPVKHGRWLNHHAIWIDQAKIEGWFVQAKCSECEKWAHVMNPYTKSVDYECCPHCSARMDGGAENDNNG